MAGNFVDLKLGGTYKVDEVKTGTRQDGNSWQRITIISENGKTHFQFFNEKPDERIRDGDIVKVDDLFCHSVRRPLNEYEKRQNFLNMNDIKVIFSLAQEGGGFGGGSMDNSGFAPGGFDAGEGDLPF